MEQAAQTKGEHIAMQWTEPMAPIKKAPSQGPHWSMTSTFTTTSPTHLDKDPSSTQHTCLHCGQTLRNNQRDSHRDGNTSPDFCCNGCQQAHAYIMTSGLGEYYRALESCQTKAQTVSGEREAKELSQHLSLPEVRILFEEQAAEGAPQWVFFVPTLRCAACDWLVRQVLMGADRVEDVAVNLATLRITVRPSRLGEDRWEIFAAVVTTLTRLGYRPYPPRAEAEAEAMVATQRTAWRRTALAAVCFGNTMLFAAAVYFGESVGIDGRFERLFALLSLALTLPCLFIAGRPFVLGVWNAVAPRRPLGARMTLDFPIGLAMLAGLVLSSWQTFFGNPTQVYFDSVCGLVFFLTLGRTLQGSLLYRLQRSVARTEDLLPPQAFALVSGQSVSVANGAVVPADGVVVRGQADVDESLLTGESLPVLRQEGHRVFAGTLIVAGQIDIKATETGHATRLASLSAATQDALQRPTERLTLVRRATIPLAAFILIAGLLGFVLVAASGHWFDAAERMLATLIVACPCAFALGVPLSYARAARAAAERGIIIKDMQALESLASCDTIIFDKTGTITSGHLKLRGFADLNNDQVGDSLGSRAASVTLPEWLSDSVRTAVQRSHHPISRSLFSAMNGPKTNEQSAQQQPRNLSSFVEQAGKGLAWSMITDDRSTAPAAKGLDLRLGSFAFVSSHWSAAEQLHLGHRVDEILCDLRAKDQHKDSPTLNSFGLTSCVIDGGYGHRYLAIFDDELRTNVAVTMERLRKDGLKLAIFSGDQRRAVAAVADAVGIDDSACFAAMSPEDKSARILSRQQNGQRVALVGDGLNDAVALAGAHVGLAFSSGSALSQRAAGLCLTSQDFSDVGAAVALSRSLRRTVAAALIFSLCYNVTTVVLALSGQITPLLAAVLMPSSSFVVALIAQGAGRT